MVLLCESNECICPNIFVCTGNTRTDSRRGTVFGTRAQSKRNPSLLQHRIVTHQRDDPPGSGGAMRPKPTRNARRGGRNDSRLPFEWCGVVYQHFSRLANECVSTNSQGANYSPRFRTSASSSKSSSISTQSRMGTHTHIRAQCVRVYAASAKNAEPFEVSIMQRDTFPRCLAPGQHASIEAIFVRTKPSGHMRSQYIHIVVYYLQ